MNEAERSDQFADVGVKVNYHPKDGTVDFHIHNVPALKSGDFFAWLADEQGEGPSTLMMITADQLLMGGHITTEQHRDVMGRIMGGVA